MQYCSHCSLLAEGRCPQCGRKLREPRENDPILLANTDVVRAAMLEPLLEEAQIPYSRMGMIGSAFAMSGGLAMEEIRIYVPFGAYERARDLLETVEGEEETVETEEDVSGGE